MTLPRVFGAPAARVLISSGTLLGVVAVLAFVYTLGGGASRDLLVGEMLSNLVLVCGLQVFIGTTGVLSFGHMAFVQVAAYATAIVVIPVATKARALPDIPFGLGDIHAEPWLAVVIAVAVTTVLGALVGVAVARARGLAATMITLAVLFVVDQVVKNWDELTRGAGGLSGIPQIEGNGWLYLAAFGSLVVARGFGRTRTGRFAVATREDELAAASIGIRLSIVRYVAWVVSIAVVALGGSLRAQSLGSVNPRQFTLDAGIIVLAMLVVGGMRTLTGAAIGTLLITAGNEAFRQLGDPQRLDIERFPDLFLGGVLLLVMLLMPRGLLGDRDVGAWLRTHARRHRGTEALSHPLSSGRVLKAAGISVRFGGFQVLSEAGVQVRPGEVVGLIGPNGAGKTTLFNVITGLVQETSGTVRLGELDLSDAAPHTIARAGLARTFQNLRLFRDLSVRENVDVASLIARRYRPQRHQLTTDQLLAATDLEPFAHRKAGGLDYGTQRRLELARAAALAPEYLLLDEPTSGMSDAESLAMVQQVRDIASRVGAGVLVIDHDLAFITRISDHIIVLAEGKVLAEGTPAAVRADPAVIAAYIGTHA